MATPFDTTSPSTPSYYPSHQTALLLLDYHTPFLTPLPTSSSVLTSATKILHWAREKEILIIHATIDLKSTPAPQIKNSERLTSTLASMLEGSGGGEEHISLRPLSTSNSEMEMRFERQVGLVSALSSPNLLSTLRDRGVKSLVLAGLSTSGCVMRTAVVAGEEGFVVTVLGDACADAKPGVHEAVLGVLGSRVWVLGTEEFVEGVGEVWGV